MLHAKETARGSIGTSTANPRGSESRRVNDDRTAADGCARGREIKTGRRHFTFLPSPSNGWGAEQISDIAQAVLIVWVLPKADDYSSRRAATVSADIRRFAVQVRPCGDVGLVLDRPVRQCINPPVPVPKPVDVRATVSRTPPALTIFHLSLRHLPG